MGRGGEFVDDGDGEVGLGDAGAEDLGAADPVVAGAGGGAVEVIGGVTTTQSRVAGEPCSRSRAAEWPRLRSMEQDGVVARTEYAENPPRVEYALTPLGRTLLGPMDAVCAWSREHLDSLLAARLEYERDDR
ncbi:winged helix-turn-helix transcriptional regulator [Kitasatospora sp. NPDC001159]